MKTWFGLLSILLCCRAATANDAAADLSRHLAMTQALVVVVCDGDDESLHAIAQLVEQTPWRVFCRSSAEPGLEKIRQWA